jgi:hypothetical protein
VRRVWGDLGEIIVVAVVAGGQFENAKIKD